MQVERSSVSDHQLTAACRAGEALTTLVLDRICTRVVPYRWRVRPASCPGRPYSVQRFAGTRHLKAFERFIAGEPDQGTLVVSTRGTDKPPSVLTVEDYRNSTSSLPFSPYTYKPSSVPTVEDYRKIDILVALLVVYTRTEND